MSSLGVDPILADNPPFSFAIAMKNNRPAHSSSNLYESSAKNLPRRRREHLTTQEPDYACLKAVKQRPIKQGSNVPSPNLVGKIAQSAELFYDTRQQ